MTRQQEQGGSPPHYHAHREQGGLEHPPPTSVNSRDAPTVLPAGQHSGEALSFEFPSSQMTAACVQLTKTPTSTGILLAIHLHERVTCFIFNAEKDLQTS